jgi:hypothetical protein
VAAAGNRPGFALRQLLRLLDRQIHVERAATRVVECDPKHRTLLRESRLSLAATHLRVLSPSLDRAARRMTAVFLSPYIDALGSELLSADGSRDNVWAALAEAPAKSRLVGVETAPSGYLGVHERHRHRL